MYNEDTCDGFVLSILMGCSVEAMDVQGMGGKCGFGGRVGLMLWRWGMRL